MISPALLPELRTAIERDAVGASRARHVEPIKLHELAWVGNLTDGVVLLGAMDVPAGLEVHLLEQCRQTNAGRQAEIALRLDQITALLKGQHHLRRSLAAMHEAVGRRQLFQQPLDDREAGAQSCLGLARPGIDERTEHVSQRRQADESKAVATLIEIRQSADHSSRQFDDRLMGHAVAGRIQPPPLMKDRSLHHRGCDPSLKRPRRRPRLCVTPSARQHSEARSAGRRRGRGKCLRRVPTRRARALSVPGGCFRQL